MKLVRSKKNLSQIVVYIRIVTLVLFIGSSICFSGISFASTARRDVQKNEPKIEAVVFDLGGVLVEASKMSIVKEIGVLSLFKYLLARHDPRLMQQKMFDILDEVEPLDKNGPKAFSPDGKRLLPQPLRDWLSGKKTSVKLLGGAKAFIESNPNSFDDMTQQRFIQKAINVIFSPKTFTKTISPFAKGVKFVKQCKDRGLKVLILSNFDAESYELIKKKSPDLFELFEEKNIFISGRMGTIKPDQAIYKSFIEQSDINPASCVFFDDQEENVKAAKLCGLKAVLVEKNKGLICSGPNYASMQKELDRFIGLEQQETSMHRQEA